MNRLPTKAGTRAAPTTDWHATASSAAAGTTTRKGAVGEGTRMRRTRSKLFVPFFANPFWRRRRHIATTSVRPVLGGAKGADGIEPTDDVSEQDFNAASIAAAVATDAARRIRDRRHASPRRLG